MDILTRVVCSMSLAFIAATIIFSFPDTTKRQDWIIFTGVIIAYILGVATGVVL